MSDWLLRIEPDRDEPIYEVGEVVRGRVHVWSDGGDRCRGVTLTRRWRTHGKGNPASGDELTLDLHRGPLPGSSPWELPFEVATPSGPFTYHGTCLNVDHHLEATVELSWDFNPTVEETFLLVPGADPEPPPSTLGTMLGQASDKALGYRMGIGVLLVVAGLFLLPLGLLLVGLGMVFFLPDVRRKLAAIRVGEVSAELDRRRVTPGEEVTLRVQIRSPREARITRIQATLRGRERCESGTGADRTTHAHTLHEEEVLLAGPTALAPGRPRVLEAALRVPDDAAFSFAAKDNELLWHVEVRVDIPTWPDWRRTIPLVVWPGEGFSLEPRELHPERTLPAPEGSPVAPGPEPEPESGSEPEPEPPPETPASAVSPPAVSASASLADAVRAVLDEPRFGGRREERLAELAAAEWTFDLRVERVERSFGVWNEDAYRDGRTVVGTIAGAEVPVVVRFTPAENGRVGALAPGDHRRVRGTVVELERLRERPVVHAMELMEPA